MFVRNQFTSCIFQCRRYYAPCILLMEALYLQLNRGRSTDGLDQRGNNVVNKCGSVRTKDQAEVLRPGFEPRLLNLQKRVHLSN